MKINYLAPTIAPAPSSYYQIEDLSSAQSYYKDVGVKDIIIQEKFMGSRCQIYLFQNDQSYVVSKTGRVIWSRDYHKLDLSQQIEDLKQDVDWTNTKMYLLDAELMPWSALGRNLIDKKFLGYYEAIALNDPMCYSYCSDIMGCLTNYTKDRTPYFRIFDLLKIIQSDNQEIIYPDKNIIMHKLVTSTLYNTSNILSYIDNTHMDIEGYIIKPTTISRDILPAIKCRTNIFIRMLYGNIPKREIIRSHSKALARKYKRALVEHQKAWDMLHIPYDQCSTVFIPQSVDDEDDPRL